MYEYISVTEQALLAWAWGTKYIYLEYHTDKKDNEIFLISKEIQMVSVAKSYMRKGFQIYEEMGKYLTKYEEAVSQIWLSTDPFWIS